VVGSSRRLDTSAANVACLRGEQALQVALVGDEEFMHLEDVIGRDIRPAPNRPRVQLELEFEHRV
jgi:hypothetical protein